MVRAQMQFTEGQMEALKRLSAQTGRSVSDLVREGVDTMLSSARQPTLEERKKRALAVMGRFRSGDTVTDVSERHDDYLAEIYGQW